MDLWCRYSPSCWSMSQLGQRGFTHQTISGLAVERDELTGPAQRLSCSLENSDDLQTVPAVSQRLRAQTDALQKVLALDTQGLCRGQVRNADVPIAIRQVELA